MRQTRIPLPLVGIIAGTRVALGVGIGLLVSERFAARSRRRAALGLVALGGLSTIPIVRRVLAGTRPVAAT